LEQQTALQKFTSLPLHCFLALLERQETQTLHLAREALVLPVPEVVRAVEREPQQLLEPMVEAEGEDPVARVAQEGAVLLAIQVSLAVRTLARVGVGVMPQVPLEAHLLVVLALLESLSSIFRVQ
jgi:hypothetical protein